MLFTVIGVWSTALLVALAAVGVLARRPRRAAHAGPAARAVEGALAVLLGAGVWLWGTGPGIGRSWLVGSVVVALGAVAVLEGVVLPATRRPEGVRPRAVRPVPAHRAALAVAVLVVTVAALGLQLPAQGPAVVAVAVVLFVALALLSLPLLPVPGPPGVRAATVLGTAAALVVGVGAWRADASRLPDSFSMHASGGGSAAGANGGHGGHGGHGSYGRVLAAAGDTGAGGTVSVADLTGPAPGAEAVRAYSFTVDEVSIPLAGGGTLAGLGVNGSSPGPVLRAAAGDRVTVELRNDSAEPTSLHWHGVDLPNSQDGVAGLTQDAVAPGATHRYSWIAGRAGTYWYHAHQDSAEQVRRGVFGAIVVDPAPSAGEVPADVDRTLLAHSWLEEQPELRAAEPVVSETVAPGATVRARFVNTDNDPHTITVATPFRVAALDGRDIPGGAELPAGTTVSVPAGGRADLTFLQPAVGATELRLVGSGQVHRFGTGDVPDAGDGGTFDLTSYGTPDPAALTALASPDREHQIAMTARLGFYDGSFGFVNTLNRGLLGDADMLMVAEGELVQVTVTNRSYQVHPMHLHGHHVTVVARNGEPVTGHPMQLDSLDVEPRESWTVVFRADNPGLWMYHCHNLLHAANGMDLMLGYEGVTTPYLVGGPAGNKPE